MSDFYEDSARRRLEVIDAERQAALADLSAHKMNQDHDSAAQTIQTIADLDSARQRCVDLYQRYVASNTPPAPREVSPEERLARPISHMDWSDVVEMTRGSKYARNIKPDDPALLAGWQEVRARRSRGE